MKKKIDVDVEISAEDMVNELWSFDAVEQSNFLYELARLYKFNIAPFLQQLQSVADEINCESDEYGKDLIVRMLETVLDYLKEEK
jgi:hypothetical protein